MGSTQGGGRCTQGGLFWGHVWGGVTHNGEEYDGGLHRGGSTHERGIRGDGHTLCKDGTQFVAHTRRAAHECSDAVCLIRKRYITIDLL